jgi:hypothetical protein
MNATRPNRVLTFEKIRRREKQLTYQAPIVPLYDEYRCGNTPPQLIGWYNFRTGLILTANFNISMTGTKIAQRRTQALNELIAKAKREAASVEAEATAQP